MNPIISKQLIAKLSLSIFVASALGCNKSSGGGGNAAPTGGVVQTNLPPGSTIVKIVAMNGMPVDQNHNSLGLYNGESVSLRADLFDKSNHALGMVKESFVWFADDSESDYCDVAMPADCAANSHFRVTADGVQFVLSGGLTQNVVISVESKDPSAVDPSGQLSVDAIGIQNLGLAPSPNPVPVPQPTPYPQPEPYPQPLPQPPPYVDPYPPAPYPPHPVPMPPPHHPHPLPPPYVDPNPPMPYPGPAPAPHPHPAPQPPPHHDPAPAPQPPPHHDPAPAPQPPPHHDPAPAPQPPPHHDPQPAPYPGPNPKPKPKP